MKNTDDEYYPLLEQWVLDNGFPTGSYHFGFKSSKIDREGNQDYDLDYVCKYDDFVEWHKENNIEGDHRVDKDYEIDEDNPHSFCNKKFYVGKKYYDLILVTEEHYHYWKITTNLMVRMITNPYLFYLYSDKGNRVHFFNTMFDNMTKNKDLIKLMILDKSIEE